MIVVLSEKKNMNAIMTIILVWYARRLYLTTHGLSGHPLVTMCCARREDPG